jgi:hypothetical protein
MTYGSGERASENANADTMRASAETLHSAAGETAVPRLSQSKSTPKALRLVAPGCLTRRRSRAKERLTGTTRAWNGAWGWVGGIACTNESQPCRF